MFPEQKRKKWWLKLYLRVKHKIDVSFMDQKWHKKLSILYIRVLDDYSRKYCLVQWFSHFAALVWLFCVLFLLIKLYLLSVLLIILYYGARWLLLYSCDEVIWLIYAFKEDNMFAAYIKSFKRPVRIKLSLKFTSRKMLFFLAIC